MKYKVCILKLMTGIVVGIFLLDMYLLLLLPTPFLFPSFKFSGGHYCGDLTSAKHSCTLRDSTHPHLHTSICPIWPYAYCPSHRFICFCYRHFLNYCICISFLTPPHPSLFYMSLLPTNALHKVCGEVGGLSYKEEKRSLVGSKMAVIPPPFPPPWLALPQAPHPQAQHNRHKYTFAFTQTGFF